MLHIQKRSRRTDDIWGIRCELIGDQRLISINIWVLLIYSITYHIWRHIRDRMFGVFRFMKNGYCVNFPVDFWNCHNFPLFPFRMQMDRLWEPLLVNLAHTHRRLSEFTKAILLYEWVSGFLNLKIFGKRDVSIFVWIHLYWIGLFYGLISSQFQIILCLSDCLSSLGICDSYSHFQMRSRAEQESRADTNWSWNVLRESRRYAQCILAFAPGSNDQSI